MKKLLKNVLISLLFAALAFVLAYYQPAKISDYSVTDNMYSRIRKTNNDIFIICIDEETLREYGSFTTWSRNKIADAVNFLYSDPNNAPAVIGIDVTFQGETTKENDDKLTNACKGDNKHIVVSAPIVFKGTFEKNEDSLEYNSYNIELIEYPYDALNKEVSSGYTNAFSSSDEITRCTRVSIDTEDGLMRSFSYELANTFANQRGITIPKINEDSNGLSRFFYAGHEGDYPHASLKTVLDGKIPVSEFNNKIVLIGAYATGMQDAYFTTADIGTSMNGVEIHANIIQSILDGSTARQADNLLYSIILSIIVFVISMLMHYTKYFIGLALPIISGVAHLFIGKYLANGGLLITQLYAIIIFALLFVYILITRFVVELNRRKHITSVFNRYMDPKVVNKLANSEHKEELNLNGVKKDVAVLFVDIRGFTSMSENMDPEDVVHILNEYLGLVTDCIFKHNGMLDKFIGDAAMAVFNAPLDQEDYIYEAVATAYDIAQGSKVLSDKLLEKFGKTVSYGVGVHIGKAVIGNIGCKARMDYTAIGDTVNTSSRIEGKAGKGEILISKEVKEALNDRIVVEDAGLIELKGKSEPLNVYRLINLADK